MSYVTDRFDEEITSLLKKGGVGLLPSDTIYGLSGLASSRAAVERIHSIKRRDKTKPFVILIADISQLAELGISSEAVAPALPYWPGGLTVICDAPKAPGWLHMGTQSLAVRQPGFEELRGLIHRVGPIVSTSANIQGGQPAASAEEARSYFGDKLDFYLDWGELKGEPSTIVRPVDVKLKVIRAGAVKIEEQEKK